MSTTDEHVMSGDELLTLGKQLLAEGRDLRMRLGGRSMFPTLRAGDVATIVPVTGGQPNMGDVVVCDRGDRWVAHRLIRMEQTEGGLRYITQGDSCMRPDEPFGNVTLLGRIIAVNRKGRVIPHDARPRYLGLTRPVIWLYITARAVAGTCLRIVSGIRSSAS